MKCQIVKDSVSLTNILPSIVEYVTILSTSIMLKFLMIKLSGHVNINENAVNNNAELNLQVSLYCTPVQYTNPSKIYIIHSKFQIL